MMLRVADLAAAALDGLFDHPVGLLDVVSNFVPSVGLEIAKWFFNSLLGGHSRARKGERKREGRSRLVLGLIPRVWLIRPASL